MHHQHTRPVDIKTPNAPELGPDTLHVNLKTEFSWPVICTLSKKETRWIVKIREEIERKRV